MWNYKDNLYLRHPRFFPPIQHNRREPALIGEGFCLTTQVSVGKAISDSTFGGERKKERESESVKEILCLFILFLQTPSFIILCFFFDWISAQGRYVLKQFDQNFQSSNFCVLFHKWCVLKWSFKAYVAHAGCNFLAALGFWSMWVLQGFLFFLLNVVTSARIWYCKFWTHRYDQPKCRSFPGKSPETFSFFLTNQFFLINRLLGQWISYIFLVHKLWLILNGGIWCLRIWNFDIGVV